jgi:hypothetical protein
MIIMIIIIIIIYDRHGARDDELRKHDASITNGWELIGNGNDSATEETNASE